MEDTPTEGEIMKFKRTLIVILSLVGLAAVGYWVQEKFDLI